jgi:UDP-MurNAc hydroxylase
VANELDEEAGCEGNPMEIEWVNHAGFVLNSSGVAVFSDPWIEGAAFDESWSLLSKTTFGYEDFARVSHIWFSHEHPDHFSPPNLKRIPQQYREKISVLFQTTIDKRVISVCRDLKFRDTTELTGDWLQLADDLEILCGTVGSLDSWAAFRTPGQTLLNLNDCVFLSVQELEPLKRKIGPIDTLVTQFSYASWWGNRDSKESWEQAARDQLEKIRREVDILKPKFVVLSASFVYFSHEENHYMNNWINTVHDAFEFVGSLRNVTAIVLYPGDKWNVGTPHDSQLALDRYRADLDKTRNSGFKKSATVAVDVLQDAAKLFLAKLKRKNSLILLWRIKETYIHLSDHDVLVKLSRRGLEISPSGKPDIRLSSSALHYCLKFDWGAETLFINGRFSAPPGGDKSRFFRWFSIAAANSHGVVYDVWYYLRKFRGRKNEQLGEITIP